MLYVAMTRAKEKLILVASGDGMDRTLEKLGMELMGGGVSPYSVRKGKNAAQWLLLCALCHPDGGELRKLAGVEDLPLCREDYTPWRIGWSRYEPAPAAEQPQESQPAALDMALYQRLRSQVDFTYPYSGALGVPAKVAASKLAAAQGAGREITLPRPAWLGEQGMTPAQRGTALHEFMQFADFPAAAQDPEQELQRLVAGAYLTPEQAAAVDQQRVRKFFAGDLGQRVLRSPQVEKERRFTAVIPAFLALPQWARPRRWGDCGAPGRGGLHLRGNGKLHIIDFKTDRVQDTQELWDRYGPQIRLYGYAMEEVTGMEVGELIFYSTHLDQAAARPYAREDPPTCKAFPVHDPAGRKQHS